MTNQTENLLKDLELVEVSIKDGGAIMTFLDKEAGEIREVNFNKNVYDKDAEEFVANEEKAKQVEEWSQEYFGVKFDDLGTAVGQKHDVYAYDKFNSLWEVEITHKFEKEDEGEIFQTTIDEVVDDGKAVHIYFKHNDKRYESKMTYADYMENLKEWFTNPQKKVKQYDKFKEKFGVSVEEAESIHGKEIMCEVKIAFKKYPYVEIKKPNWSK